MADMFGTRQIRDEPKHWDALAARVALTAVQESRSSGFGWLTRSSAAWFVVPVALATVAGSAIAMARQPPGPAVRLDQAPLVEPSDDVGKAMTSRDRPPAIDALLLEPTDRHR